LQGLFDGHFSQSFFIHWFTSWVEFIGDIIKRFQPQVNDVLAQKLTLKVNDVLAHPGKRCIGIWQL
jgi:hypothetical protein